MTLTGKILLQGTGTLCTRPCSPTRRRRTRSGDASSTAATRSATKRSGSRSWRPSLFRTSLPKPSSWPPDSTVCEPSGATSRRPWPRARSRGTTTEARATLVHRQHLLTCSELNEDCTVVVHGSNELREVQLLWMLTY